MDHLTEYQERFSAYFKTLSEIIKLYGPMSFSDTTILLHSVINHINYLQLQTASIHISLDPDNIHIQTGFPSLCSMTEYTDIKKIILNNLQHNGFYVDSISDSDEPSPFKNPEKVLRTQDIDSQNGVYKVASVIYYALTGHPIPDYIMRIEKDTIESPSYLNINLTSFHDQVLLQALAMKPSDRFQNITDFEKAWENPEQYVRSQKLKERLERERLEKERLEQESLEKENLEKESLEKERLEKERLKEERLKEKRLKEKRLKEKRHRTILFIIFTALILVLVVFLVSKLHLQLESTPDNISVIGETGAKTSTAAADSSVPAGVQSTVDFIFAETNVLTQYRGRDSEVIVPDGTVRIGSSAFENCQSMTRLVLPDTVIEIDDKAFSNCNNLTDIEFSSSLEKIGKSAFSRCNAIRSLQLPDSLLTIDNSAFTGCTNLSSIKFGNNLQTIGRLAFSGCSNLSMIELPESLQLIKAYAFQSCSDLTDVYIYSQNCKLEEDVFSGCGGFFTLYGYKNSGVHEHTVDSSYFDNEGLNFKYLE